MFAQTKSQSKHKVYNVFAMMIFALSHGCASSYSITTKPIGVEILSGSKSLGKTPLDLSKEDFTEEMAGGYLLKLKKTGYKPVNIWIPNEDRQYNINININPFYTQKANDNASREKRDIQRDKVYSIIERLFNIQKSLHFNDKNPEDLKKDLQELDNLLELNQFVGTLHYLKALQKIGEEKIDEAKLYIRDAVRYSPNQPDFIVIKNELEKPTSKK